MEKIDEDQEQDEPSAMSPAAGRNLSLGTTISSGAFQSTPAATAAHPPAPPEQPEAVPTWFEYQEEKGEYKVHWAYAGSVETRHYMKRHPDDPFATETVELEPGEKAFPPNATEVLTRQVKPIVYPTGCPKITAEILNSPQPVGEGWLRWGREALMDGLRDGTIPKN